MVKGMKLVGGLVRCWKDRAAIAAVVGLASLAAQAQPDAQMSRPMGAEVASPSDGMSRDRQHVAVGAQKYALDRPLNGMVTRGSPPLGGGCQVADNNQGVNYATFLAADNFNAAANGTVTAVSWSGAYQAGTANGTPPASETFTIRFFTDGGGFPGTVIAGPIAVNNPTRVNSGTFLGALTIWDYTANIAGGPAVTAGTCYWIEIRNTSTIAAPNTGTFWITAAAPPGDTFSAVAFANNCNSNGYSPFDLNIGDLTFCLNIGFNPLDGINCPFPIPPVPMCQNPQANGQGTTPTNGGIFSNSVGSTYTANPRFQVAEKFQLAPGAGGNLTSVCFWGFFAQQAAGQRLEPCTKQFDVIVWNSDPVTGLPTTVVGQRRANVDAGVTLTRGQDAAFNDIWTVNFAGNPIPLMADTCYHLTISHLHTTTNVNMQGTFVWGTVPDNAGNPLLDNTIAVRAISAAGVAGAWGNFSNIGANTNNMSFLLNLGPVVPTTCALPTPGNDTCQTATTLPLNGTIVTGFNANGTNEPLPGCGFDLVVGPTVWYKFTGTGNNVTITTCNPGTNFDTILAVFCGASDCNGPFTCVGSNDDAAAVCAAAAGASTLTIPTSIGQQYFAVVYGAQVINDLGQTTATSSTGSFAISATEGGAAVNPPTCASLARCVLDSEPFDFAETDVCGAVDGVDTNNACLGASIYPALGQVGRGTLATSPTGDQRDIDFFILPQEANGQTVTVSIRCESPVVCQILNEATGACGAAFTVVPNTTLFIASCLDLDILLFEVTLPATGRNYLLLTMPNFDGNPCGTAPNSQNDYRVLVDVSPLGACCVDQFTACSTGTIFACAASGGTAFFAGVPCSLGSPAVDTCSITPGACCLPDNTCQGVPSTNVPSGADCANTGGTFTAGQVCDPNPCGAATGACCCGSTCRIASSAACVGLNTAYAGDNTACNAPGNTTTPCCFADFNHFLGANSPQVTVQDVFDFLGAFFSNDACGDINGTGLPLTVQDVFDYLSAFFSAPVGGGC